LINLIIEDKQDFS